MEETSTLSAENMEQEEQRTVSGIEPQCEDEPETNSAEEAQREEQGGEADANMAQGADTPGDTEQTSSEESEQPSIEEEGEKGPDSAAELEQRIALLERQFAEREEQHRREARDSMLRSHFSRLEQQAEELSKTVPGFSLSQALEDPRFLRLTSPELGLSVEAAYCALHYAELMEQAEKRGAMAASRSITSRSTLPGENGAVRRETVSSQPRLYSRMSPEERLEQKRLILSGIRF